MYKCRYCGAKISRLNKDTCPLCGGRFPLEGGVDETVDLTKTLDKVNIDDVKQRKKAGEYEQICHIPANFLNWGNYAIDFHAIEQAASVNCLVYESDMVSFTIAGKGTEIGGWMSKEPGDVTPHFKCEESHL